MVHLRCAGGSFVSSFFARVWKDSGRSPIPLNLHCATKSSNGAGRRLPFANIASIVLRARGQLTPLSLACATVATDGLGCYMVGVLPRCFANSVQRWLLEGKDGHVRAK